jgi:hypothetical protein
MLKAVVLAAMLVLVLAMPSGAFAQSGCEIAHECGDTRYLPPGSPNVPSVYAWDYLTGQYRPIGQYGLAAFCQNYGGYWFMAEDGGEYWNACS